jgi:cell division inhibitor SepF
MGSWRKMGAFLGLVPEDETTEGKYSGEYGYEQGYSDRGYSADYPSDYVRQPARDDSRADRSTDYTAPATQGALAMQVRPDSRPSAESSSAARPLTVKLTGFGEARIIGERYRDGASVILDMTDLSDSDARRVVDFAAGLAFAMHGSIDKVTTRVFMLLPPHADMSAEDRRAFAGSYAAR